MERPQDLFDRTDEWASLDRFCADPTPGASLGLVSGRRRQGKSYLLEAICERTNGFYFQAVEATAAESLAMFGERLGQYVGSPGPIAFPDWSHAVDALLRVGRNAPTPAVIDELPYLTKSSPVLPSIIQASFGPRRRERRESRTRLILCGSALTVMGKLLAGDAPLRGRASLELTVHTFDYRVAREFWGIGDPRLALLTHAIVGGSPAYRDYVRGDAPKSLRGFADWVVRAVLDPASPLLKEARYLLTEDQDLRGLPLYHSVLAAVASGHTLRGAIASYLGRKTTDLAHPLAVLEDGGYLIRADDLFRSRRPVWRIAEPLIGFYHAIMRPNWADLERPGRAAQVWDGMAPTFQSQVMGPHFERICRVWSMLFADPATFGADRVGEVGAGVVTDGAQRTQHEVDVVVLGAHDGGRRKVLALGEAKWSETMGIPQLDRLRRIRSLLAAADRFDVSRAIPVCFSGAGFTATLNREAAAGNVVLVDLDRLYHGG